MSAENDLIDERHLRSAGRVKRIRLSAIAALGSKISTISVSLISIPLVLKYLGTERFGLWMAISSIVSMLVFADFGIGNGLLNVTAAAYGRDDFAAIRRYISSAFALLGAIAVSILVVFFLAVYPLLDWAHVFNVSTAAARVEAGPAMAVLMICVALNIPATIMQRLQMAMQMGFSANLWLISGSLGSLLAIWWITQVHGSLGALIAALVGTPVLAWTLSGIWLFSTRPNLRPSWRNIDLAAGRQVANVGLVFMVLQIVTSITYASDKVIIARILGADSIASYAVYERLSMLGVGVIQMLLQPMWPAYADAWARDDIAWVKKAFKKSLIISTGFGVAFAAFIYIFSDQIILKWTGHSIEIPTMLKAGFTTWSIIQCIGYTMAMLLNGLNIVKYQLIIASITALVALPLKIISIPLIGSSGAVWASSISFFIFALFPYCLLLPKILAKNNLNARIKKNT